MTSQAKKVILDVDTGIDDALAIAFACSSPELEVLAIGTVSGNVGPVLGAENTLKLLAAMELDIPVAVGADRPLVEPVDHAEFVHGEDGLGNLDLPASGLEPQDEHAVDQLIRLLSQHRGEVTLIPVGPLTNLALALRREPRIAEWAKEVILMGGVAMAPGNMGPMVEANIGHDPEAAEMVFTAGWPVTMVGLDVTTRVFLTEARQQQLAGSDREVTRIVGRAADFYLDFYKSVYGHRKSPLHDPLAVGVAIDHSLVTTQALTTHVELAGAHTRGMVVADLRGLNNPQAVMEEPLVNICTDVDSDRFTSLFMQRLLAN